MILWCLIYILYCIALIFFQSSLSSQLKTSLFSLKNDKVNAKRTVRSLECCTLLLENVKMFSLPLPHCNLLVINRSAAAWQIGSSRLLLNDAVKAPKAICGHCDRHWSHARPCWQAPHCPHRPIEPCAPLISSSTADWSIVIDCAQKSGEMSPLPRSTISDLWSGNVAAPLCGRRETIIYIKARDAVKRPSSANWPRGTKSESQDRAHIGAFSFCLILFRTISNDFFWFSFFCFLFKVIFFRFLGLNIKFSL